MDAKSTELSRIKHLKCGDSASMRRTVQEEDAAKMAEISGDYNPVHLDEAYAQRTRFGSRIAHGLFCSSMVSALLGTQLPGLGTVIISEEMRFLAPVYFGDTVTATVKVEELSYEKNKVTLSFLCSNQENTHVMVGTAKVVVM